MRRFRWGQLSAQRRTCVGKGFDVAWQNASQSAVRTARVAAATLEVRAKSAFTARHSQAGSHGGTHARCQNAVSCPNECQEDSLTVHNDDPERRRAASCGRPAVAGG